MLDQKKKDFVNERSAYRSNLEGNVPAGFIIDKITVALLRYEVFQVFLYIFLESIQIKVQQN